MGVRVKAVVDDEPVAVLSTCPPVDVEGTAVTYVVVVLVVGVAVLSACPPVDVEGVAVTYVVVVLVGLLALSAHVVESMLARDTKS